MGGGSSHLVLLGDSTFDNKFYVERGNPSIIEQLQAKASERGWKASSCATDGHSIRHIALQLTRIPADTTHLFVSIGGNDVLDQMNVLKQSTSTIGQSLLVLDEQRKQFETDYIQMLDQLQATSLPFAVCTIYRPSFEHDEQQRMCQTALSLFNEIILRESIKRGIPLIDLTTVFDDRGDYANHIEPDVRGGEKIVRNILFLVDQHRFDHQVSSVYAK